MFKINVEIEGICPILFNKFYDPSSLEKVGKKKTKSKSIEDAELKVYKNKAKDLCMPAVNLKKALLLGCASAVLKVGRRGAQAYMRATVFFEPDFISFGRKKHDGIHECTGRNPNTKGMVIIRRPYLDTGWKLKFKLLGFDERITKEAVKISLEEAGKIIGLCDHRPEYGRFQINKFEV